MSTTLNLDDVAQELCQQRGYEFHGGLGKGAFKSAYLISTTEGKFALKLAAVTIAPDRLLREANALQACSHHNIAHLQEAFSYAYGSSLIWAVREEYLSGGTLEERLKSEKLALHVIKDLGLKLAQVLNHLYERRLVHRDIKPANILFRSAYADPVLTDFGIVRALDEPALTKTFLGMGPGTPAYAAPEQLNNEKNQIDWRTDQFGLAVVLSECLIGRHPHSDSNVHEAIAAVAAKKQPAQSAVKEIQEMGFGCLVKALQPWPVSRYRRPEDFINELANI